MDLVILTHLHTDHVGRNTRDEWEHCGDTDLDDLADVTGAPVEVAPGIPLLPVPGIPRGRPWWSCAARAGRHRSPGDSFHHPARIADPAITSTADSDPAVAAHPPHTPAAHRSAITPVRTRAPSSRGRTATASSPSHPVT